MATTPTTHFGFGKPTDGASNDIWGQELNAFMDLLDSTLWNLQQTLEAQVLLAAPTGEISDFMLPSAPAGWIACTGTIGNPSSGATFANNNAEALYLAIWSIPALITQTSAGSPIAKGVSAAADWAANKRLTLPPQSGRVRRSIGGLAPALGATQEDAIQNITGTVGCLVPTTSNGSAYVGTGAFLANGSLHNSYAGAGASVRAATFDASRVARTATETRVASVGYLTCIKL